MKKMFYDYNLMKSSTLGVAWCYANRQKVVCENVGIPKICSTIEKFVDYDGTRRRLSLRSSTLLLNGTARLYKEELDKLYQDCIELDSQILYRRSRNASLSDDNNSGTEGNLRNSKNGNENQNHRNSRLNHKNNPEISRPRSKGSTEHGSSAMISFTSDRSSVSNQTHDIDKVDAEVQTYKSYIRDVEERHKRRRKHTFDVNLPTSVIMVYDEFNSNTPSKIICANINKNVKYL